ncbi:MAG: PaaI family thioesterase [Planctomycetota bacterium]|nr:PaaI family thioesterase [Planctomycetota bacterium]
MMKPPESWKGSFGDRLGMEYEHFEPGHTVASFVVTEVHRNPPGVCHGGAVFTCADDTMGAAVFPLSPEGTLPTANQVDIRLVRSAQPGERLRAESRVIHHGRRTAVAESRVTDEEGRLVALATGSFLFVETR